MNSFEFAKYLVKKAKGSNSSRIRIREIRRGHIRISYTTSVKNIGKTIERIKVAVEKLP